MGRALSTFSFRAWRRLSEMTGRFEQSSYSQMGEDLIACFVLEALGIVRPSYIDVGAHHPWKFNNTALFYLRGGQGINVDANAKLMAAFQSERSRDENLAVAIDNASGSRTLYIMEQETL